MDSRPILLVEDNPDDVELTLHALRQMRIPNEVVIARDGSEALNLLYGGDPRTQNNVRLIPSVVLLDLKLPGIDGFEVLKRIRGDDLTRLIPVIILTSSRERLDLINGYRSGANSYVRKPVDFEQFLVTVRQLGDYWLKLNEPIS